jgi:tetratricopeptide (TPR) repeat protein
MRAAKDDWYQNKTWNGRIDSLFEDGLKRTRNGGNKAEYLKVQGCILLNSPQANIREVGIALLTRLFTDFPSEYYSVLPAQEKLGDYYLSQKNYQQAASYFMIVTDHCSKQNSRTGTSNMADLKWAETIVKIKQSDKMEAAYQLVIDYPAALLKTNDSKLYYVELAAHICDRLNKKEEAAAFAKTAIELRKLTKPSTQKSKPTINTSPSY